VRVTDIVDKQTRSRMMAGIKGKDTKPELALRRALHMRGFRFRLHSKKVQGRPDLVLAKHRVVVFVHGCFWHRHKDCRYTTTPATRPEFWNAKFKANVARDSAVRASLMDGGWRVVTVWECALRRPQMVEEVVALFESWLNNGSRSLEIGRNDLSIESDPAS